MRLQQLSLRGFKSFANRTTLKFEPGITVIVGPNGSGKSNITDAILWVLGEQRARTLRGASMEDVIFAGSASQASLGVAEVSLSLDNSDGTISLDFSEVVITRRLFRSGESEYRINNSPVRLLDIQELLSDSGIGREMYSVISQGRLDEVLSCRPEERRALIEEAAGTLKHKKRKDRALRRLTSMQEFLTRAKDVLGEVNRQLEPLRHQADVAREQDSLTKELRGLEVVVAVAELRGYQTSWQDATREEESAEERLTQANTALTAARQNIRELEAQAESVAESLRVLLDKRGEAFSVIQRLGANRMLLQEKAKNYRRRIEEAQRLSRDLGEREATLTIGIDDGVTEADRLLLELEEVRTLIEPQINDSVPDSGVESRPEQLRDIEELIVARRAILKSARTDQQSGASAVAKLEEEQRLIEQRLGLLSGSQAEDSAALQDAGERLRKANEELEARVLECDEAQAELAVARSERDLLLPEVAAVSSRLAAADAALTVLRSLEEASVGLEKYVDASEDRQVSVLSLKRLLRVESGYERAVDVALVGAIDALLVDDEQHAVRILKQAAALGVQGEVIVPRACGPKEHPSVDLPKASEFVFSSAEKQRLVDMLLGHVYFAVDIDRALAVADKLLAHELIVTLKGDVVTGYGGIRSGGGERHLGTMELAKQLAAKIESRKELELALTELKEREGRAGTVLDEARVRLELVAAQAQALEVLAGGVRQEVVSNTARLSDTEAELAGARQQLKMVSEGLAAARTLEADSLQAVSAAEAGLTAAEADMEALNKKREAVLLQEKAASQELSVLREAAAVLCEKHRAMLARVESLRQQRQDVALGLRGQDRQQTATRSAANRLELVTPVLQRLVEAARKLETALGADLEVSQEKAREIRFQLQEWRASSGRFRHEIEKVSAAKNDAQVRRVQLEIQVNNLVSRLVDELDVPMERALESTPADADLTVSRQALRRVKARLAALGPYNPLAWEQFRELEERSCFLTKQVEDLTVSSRALHKLVGAIDEKMRRRFLTCLDDLNSNFQRVFAILFPGGQAALVPTDAGDIMEAGIEIEAQPEGKKLQSLALLSGGERALVGLALLFAICYTRPSPFYVLDEVDAPLDDVNTTRLAGLLESLARETQMIVITHQRRTMEIADSIYGVSMQAQGVSKLMSQKLGDHAKGGDDDSGTAEPEKQLAEQAAHGPE